MPEGPSIVILREKIEALNLEGKKVNDVIGTTDLAKERMLHLPIKAFKSWGKHFLICFDNFALRIHLMMFGSYRINSHKAVKPKIGFRLGENELNFYTCDLKFVEGNLEETYDWSADIMSDEWETKVTVNRLKEHLDDLVCDVLLNQQVFSGAGNIIKNEVLYRIGVQPSTKIGNLTPTKLKSLAQATRAYAFDFLKWKKANVLKKHWEVYGQKTCPKNHQITKIELGKNKRVCYYCPTCQKKYT